MRLTFIGHACALLDFEAGRVLTDPYSPVIGGYTPVDTEADVVTLSHSNPKWHSCLDDVCGAFAVFEGLSHVGRVTRLRQLELEAIRVFERLWPGMDETSAHGGEGPNTMIKATGDGIRILHMGDVGHPLTAATVAECGEVDVVLAPAGGRPTLALDDLLNFVAALRPHLVIPVHYAVDGLAMTLLPVEALIARWTLGEVVRHQRPALDVKEMLSRERSGPELHVLPPLRLASATL